MRLLPGVICAFVLSAGPALAGPSFTGVFSGGEGTGQIDLSGYADGTDFHFRFTTAAPVLSGVAEYVYVSGFDQYFDVTGVRFGGDDEPTYQDHAITSSPYSTTLTTPNDYRLYYADGDLSESDYFHPETVSVDVFVPDTYDGRSFTFSVDVVPEPASWALLIGGLGVIGVAGRRRRTQNLGPPRTHGM